MQATKIFHKGEERIKVDFPYNQDIASKLRQIIGAKWSTTFKAWHIPSTKADFEQLKTLFPEIEYPKKVVVNTEKPVLSTLKKENGVIIDVFERKILIKLPKKDADTQFLLKIRFSKWDAKQFCWIIPNYKGNLALLQDYFNN